MHRTLIILSLSGALAAQGRQAGTDMLQSSGPEPQGQLLADINLLGADYGDETAPIPNDALTRTLGGLHTRAYKAGLGNPWWKTPFPTIPSTTRRPASPAPSSGTCCTPMPTTASSSPRGRRIPG